MLGQHAEKPARNSGAMIITRRREGVGIIFGGDHISGQPLKTAIENGDYVVLRIGTESVQVEVVLILKNSTFRGKVIGFEPSFSLEHQGLTVGDEVTFEEANIISCSSKG